MRRREMRCAPLAYSGKNRRGVLAVTATVAKTASWSSTNLPRGVRGRGCSGADLPLLLLGSMVASRTFALYALLSNATIDLLPIRMLVQQLKHVCHAKLGIPGIKRLQNARHKFEILFRIDGPPMAAEVRLNSYRPQFESLRPPVDKRRHMLALGLAGCLSVRRGQRCRRKYLDCHAIGVGELEHVGNVVVTPGRLKKSIDSRIDDRRIQ